MPKILFVTLSNVGDAVLTTPVLQRLVETHGAGAVTVLAGPKAAPLFHEDQALAHVIAYDKHAPLREKIKLLRELRRERFMRVVDMRHTLFPLWILGLRGLPSMLKPRQSHGHAVQRHWHKAFGSVSLPEPLTWRLRVSESSLQKAEALLGAAHGPYIGIAAGAASELKRWPKERFENIANRMTQEGMGTPVFLGAEAETFRCPGALNLTRKTDLGAFAAVLRRCAVLLSNDSGPMHMGAALGIPVIALFGPSDAERYAPYGPGHRVLRLDLTCSPCGKAQCPLGTHACMQDLKEETVWQAIKTYFSAARTA